MKITHFIFFIILLLFSMSSCEDEVLNENQVVGLWQQVSVTEDGNELALTAEQKTLKILIEPNGIYRSYHQSFMSYNNSNGPTTFFGTWSLHENNWLNMSTDKWQFNPTIKADSMKVNLSYKQGTNEIDTLKSVQRQWAKNHIQSRFTILKLTPNELEIRLKTFEGEKRYALLFAPSPSDFVEITNPGAGKDSFIPKLITDDNYLSIRKEFQTIKTYVYKFNKVSY